jgi:hypothetical protein
MALPANSHWLDQFEKGKPAGGHAGEVEAIPSAVPPAMTARRFPAPWRVDPAEARQAKMRSEDQGMLGGGAGSKKCATTTAAMTARMAIQSRHIDRMVALAAQLNARPAACPSGIVPRACPSGTALGTPAIAGGTVGTFGTIGTAGTHGTAETGWTETYEESAAIAEHDGRAPRERAEAFARLDPAWHPGDVPHRRWLQFVDDCGAFLDSGWPTRAQALGWGPLDLFGCDRHRPFARIDRLGLLWLLNGRRIVALTVDSATIMTSNGGRLTYRRVPNDPGQVLVWELTT